MIKVFLTSYFSILTFHRNQKLVEIYVSVNVISNYVPNLTIPIEPIVILYHIDQSIIVSNIENGTEFSKISTYLNI